MTTDFYDRYQPTAAGETFGARAGMVSISDGVESDSSDLDIYEALIDPSGAGGAGGRNGGGGGPMMMPPMMGMGGTGAGAGGAGAAAGLNAGKLGANGLPVGPGASAAGSGSLAPAGLSGGTAGVGPAGLGGLGGPGGGVPNLGGVGGPKAGLDGLAGTRAAGIDGADGPDFGLGVPRGGTAGTPDLSGVDTNAKVPGLPGFGGANGPDLSGVGRDGLGAKGTPGLDGLGSGPNFGGLEGPKFDSATADDGLSGLRQGGVNGGLGSGGLNAGPGVGGLNTGPGLDGNTGPTLGGARGYGMGADTQNGLGADIPDFGTPNLSGGVTGANLNGNGLPGSGAGPQFDQSRIPGAGSPDFNGSTPGVGGIPGADRAASDLDQLNTQTPKLPEYGGSGGPGLTGDGPDLNPGGGLPGGGLPGGGLPGGGLPGGGLPGGGLPGGGPGFQEPIEVSVGAIRDDASKWEQLAGTYEAQGKVAKGITLNRSDFSYAADELFSGYDAMKKNIDAFFTGGAKEFRVLAEKLNKIADGYDKTEAENTTTAENSVK